MYRVNYGQGQVSGTFRTLKEASRALDAEELYKEFMWIERYDAGSADEPGHWVRVRPRSSKNPEDLETEGWRLARTIHRWWADDIDVSEERFSATTGRFLDVLDELRKRGQYREATDMEYAAHGQRRPEADIGYDENPKPTRSTKRSRKIVNPFG